MPSQRVALLLIAALLSSTGCSADHSAGDDTGVQRHADADADGDEDAGADGGSHDSGQESDADRPQDADSGADADAGDQTADSGDVGRAPDAGSCGLADDPSDEDGDGLFDCEETALCTDPTEPDTDEDGLNDMREISMGTDACDADTDGDGVDDGHEVDIDLDPLNPSTYDDGKLDRERWFVDACDAPESEPIRISQNNVANWRLALSPNFHNNLVELDIDGADIDNRYGASMYEDPANEIVGFLISGPPNSSQRSSSEAVRQFKSLVDSHGEIDQESVGGGFRTHDAHQSAMGRFLLAADSPRSPHTLREQLMLGSAAFAERDIDDPLPTTDGATYQMFRIFVSITLREYLDGQEQVLMSVAIAPAAKYESNEEIQFRMDDLINTTNLAAASSDDERRCDIFQADATSMVDFYWVLDHSGSMHDDYTRVYDVADQFFAELTNSGLNYRLGVTNMEESVYGGRLREEAGWHTDLETFLTEIEEYVEYCTGCSNAGEYGLNAAEKGIKYMKGLDGSPGAMGIRSEAELVTIWMTDDEELELHSMSGSALQQRINHWVDFFKQHTTGFAIVENDPNGTCGVRQGNSYMQVAEASGGSHTSLCASDLSETIEDIIYAASGRGGQALPHTPISSSLRVYLDDAWVPRSRANGFDYFAESNTVAFFGEFRPTLPEDDDEASEVHLSVTYERFSERAKEFVSYEE